MHRKAPDLLARCYINCIDITMPLNFLASINDQLAEGAIRDAVGQILFGEKLSPEIKSALHYEGINSNLIVVRDRGNK